MKIHKKHSAVRIHFNIIYLLLIKIYTRDVSNKTSKGQSHQLLWKAGEFNSLPSCFPLNMEHFIWLLICKLIILQKFIFKPVIGKHQQCGLVPNPPCKYSFFPQCPWTTLSIVLLLPTFNVVSVTILILDGLPIYWFPPQIPWGQKLGFKYLCILST